MGSQEIEEERNLRLRKNVLDEIVTSENSYIEQLDTLLNVFVRPVKEKNLISKHNFSSIFGDIEPIYSLNLVLNDELRKGNVGAAFFKIAPYLKLYSTYAQDYELAIKSLQNLRKSNKTFEAFVAQQESLPHICRKLEALLIVPIQRVPRYRLLLTELVSLTKEEDPEFATLNAALKQIENVAQHINEQIREQENMQRIIRIQRSLLNGNPKIVTPGRRFIKEGSLKKVSTERDSAHERYFILFNDILLYCKIRNGHEISQKRSLICSCVFPLRHCVAEAVVGDGLFKVTCRNECLLLCSNTAEEGRNWVETINAAVQKLEANFRTLRKESSSRQPLRKRQLNQQDSFMRKYHQRDKRARTEAQSQHNFDVEFMKPENGDSPCISVSETSIATSPCTIKKPNWLSPCHGSPSFTFSPKKLLNYFSASSPKNSQVNETSLIFCSPPIQTDFTLNTE